MANKYSVLEALQLEYNESAALDAYKKYIKHCKKIYLEETIYRTIPLIKKMKHLIKKCDFQDYICSCMEAILKNIRAKAIPQVETKFTIYILGILKNIYKVYLRKLERSNYINVFSDFADENEILESYQQNKDIDENTMKEVKMLYFSFPELFYNKVLPMYRLENKYKQGFEYCLKCFCFRINPWTFFNKISVYNNEEKKFLVDYTLLLCRKTYENLKKEYGTFLKPNLILNYVLPFCNFFKPHIEKYFNVDNEKGILHQLAHKNVNNIPLEINI